MNTNSFFRQEALNNAFTRLEGDLITQPFQANRFFFWFIVTWFFLFIAWLSLTNYTKKVSVRGWIEPTSGIVKLYTPDDGVVINMLAKEGDKVVRGQPLIALKADKSLPNGQDVTRSIVTEINNEREILAERRESSEKIFIAENLQIDALLASNSSAIEILSNQKSILKERLKISRRQVARYEKLNESGQISSSDLDTAKDHLLALTGEAQSVGLQILDMKNKSRSLEIDKQKSLNSFQTTKHDINTRLVDLKKSNIELNSQNEYFITAPFDGIINNIRPHVGAHVDSTQPLLSIVSISDQLIGKAVLQVSAIGMLNENQRVEIRYDAFPHQQFGIFPGRIAGISQSIALPSELEDVPIKFDGSGYLVTLNIDSESINTNLNGNKLRAGMTFTAAVSTQQMPMIQWLFNPMKTFIGKL